MVLLTKISRAKSLELLICLKTGLCLGTLLDLLLTEEEDEEWHGLHHMPHLRYSVALFLIASVTKKLYPSLH